MSKTEEDVIDTSQPITQWNNRKKLAIPLMFLILLGFAGLIVRLDRKPIPQESIDHFIKRLNYSSINLLGHEPAAISQRKLQTTFEDLNFIVETYEKKSIRTKNANIYAIAENTHVIYPGSILLADHYLVENSPVYVSVKRQPMNYSINLYSLKETFNFSTTPEFKNYKTFLDKALNDWYDRLANETDVAADFSSKYSLAYSRDQVRTTFGLGTNYVVDKLDIDFEGIRKNEKLVMIHEFKQKFFEVSVELPDRPSDLFDASVTSEDLKNRNFSDQSPPVLVNEVSYGRSFYVKLETTSTDNRSKMALSTASTSQYETLKDFNITLLILGGGAEHNIQLTLVNSMEEVNQELARYSRFNRTHPAHPLTYTIRFVKDNSLVLVNDAADYMETIRTVHQGGAIRLTHNGFYVAQFQLDWDELGYDEFGNELSEHRTWYKNGKDLIYKFSEEQKFKGNCKNITVKAWACTGIPGDWWRKVFDEENVPLIGYREFKIDGLSFSPYHVIEPPL